MAVARAPRKSVPLTPRAADHLHHVRARAGVTESTLLADALERGLAAIAEEDDLADYEALAASIAADPAEQAERRVLAARRARSAE